MAPTSLVLTTIFEPVVLNQYLANFLEFGREGEVEVFMIPDLKTPKEAYRLCDDLKALGLKITVLSPFEQESFLRKVGLDPKMIPYNSDNRRNVGYLAALASGSDLVISIDDDNYCQPGEDFIGEHSVAQWGGHGSLYPINSSSDKWVNVCELLDFDMDSPIYMRGFPYFARYRENEKKIDYDTGSVSVHVNMGLWTGDPDVDGITWLVAKPQSKAFYDESIVVGWNSWAPINSQNTSMKRAAVASYYFIPMGVGCGRFHLERYGDIFQGYFLQSCMKQCGGQLRVGTPIALHKRNAHNYMKDATQEWGCILLLEEVLPWLTELKLSGKTYCEAYESLADELLAFVDRSDERSAVNSEKWYFHKIVNNMQRWAKACREIG